MKNYITEIEELWRIKDSLKDDPSNFKKAKQLIDQIIAELGVYTALQRRFPNTNT